MITNGIKRYLNLSLDVSIGKITDQAKTSNYNGGLLGDGQKQRIRTFARTIDSRPPILILDDILLIPNGLLKRQERIVIPATYTAQPCRLGACTQFFWTRFSSSQVDGNDIAAVKDQELEEEVVLNLDNESEVLEEELDTPLTTDKRLYSLL
ncbi:hypothetical protein ABEW05_010889 [Botrytis cinerea]